MIVYTAIFASFDRLRAPRIINPGWDYVCICNPQIPVPAPWRISVCPQVRSPRFSARYYKILSHKTFPKTTITIWHGGNVQLRTDPTLLLDIMGDKDIAILRHSERTNVYHEGDICIDWKKDSAQVIRAQMSRYVAEGFDGNPLSAAFLLVRRNTEQIKKLNEVWYNEVKNGSIRDQLSFDYSCWKLGIKPVIIPGNLFSGPHFVRHPEHAK